jgi:hypothetical protein
MLMQGNKLVGKGALRMKAKVFEAKNAAELETKLAPFLKDLPKIHHVTQSECAQGRNEAGRIITVTVFYAET